MVVPCVAVDSTASINSHCYVQSNTPPTRVCTSRSLTFSLAFIPSYTKSLHTHFHPADVHLSTTQAGIKQQLAHFFLPLLPDLQSKRTQIKYSSINKPQRHGESQKAVPLLSKKKREPPEKRGRRRILVQGDKEATDR